MKHNNYYAEQAANVRALNHVEKNRQYYPVKYASAVLLVLLLFLIAPASADSQLYSAKLTDTSLDVYIVADGAFKAELRLLGEDQNMIVQTIGGYGSKEIKFNRPTVAGNYKVTVGKVSQYFYIEPMQAKQVAKLSTSEGFNFAVGMALVIGLLFLVYSRMRRGFP